MGDTTCASLTDFFDSYAETSFISPGLGSSGDIFSMLEVLEGVSDEFTSMVPLKSGFEHPLVSQKSNSSCIALQELVEANIETVNIPKNKRQKVSSLVEEGGVSSDGQHKVSHIAVERNRRKQMNKHLTVLRSLMPCFYVKRGDQASIIGGVVDYITELQQVLQSLEAKKQRKVYSDVLSPRPSSLSPRKPPISSPRPLLPISPRTPQPVSPYTPARLQQPNSLYIPPPSPIMANYMTPSTSLDPSPSSSSSTSDFVSVADVEVKFSGSNLLLKTISPQLPGQATKIVSVLEDLSLEILQAGINTVDETMINSFTLKIGIECQLSAEDLVQQIQQTFC